MLNQLLSSAQISALPMNGITVLPVKVPSANSMSEMNKHKWKLYQILLAHTVELMPLSHPLESLEVDQFTPLI